MKKVILIVIVLSLLFFLVPSVFAKQGHMKLLAVTEMNNGSVRGGVADLYLEIKPGTGRVFLETFPATRVDTQISTRFAKSIACDLIEEDCSRFDFFYAITADSSIIAGPSAGASIAALTAAMLKDLEIDELVAATGTINSGGLIGPVGGLKPKIEAGSKFGLRKVLIPLYESIKEDNTTISIENLSEQLGIEVVEVSTVAEVIGHFTGEDLKKEYPPIRVKKEYSNIMGSLSLELCDRSSVLLEELEKINSGINVTNATIIALNSTKRGESAYRNNEFYSSASFCFGANVQLSNLILVKQNVSEKEMVGKLELLKKEISEFDKWIEDNERKTITSLEAYMAAKERLDEAVSVAESALKFLNSSNASVEIAGRNLAYANERLNSAYSWSKFFNNTGKQFNLNNGVIKQSCRSKISEVEERLQYAEFYLKVPLLNIAKDLQDAYDELSDGNYELCLFKATKSKAESDVVLSMFGIDQSNLKNLLGRKLEVAEETLAKETSKDIFPILGYSYYEYSNSLKDTDVLSALLYSEYASELGNLDIYFQEEMPNGRRSNGRLIIGNKSSYIDKKLLIIFIFGVAVGFMAAFFVRRKKPDHQ